MNVWKATGMWKKMRKHSDSPFGEEASHWAAPQTQTLVSGQGVSGITKLIWGQTGDTCAPEEPLGLGSNTVVMKGGRLTVDTHASEPSSLYLTEVGTYPQQPPEWILQNLICLSLSSNVP